MTDALEGLTVTIPASHADGRHHAACRRHRQAGFETAAALRRRGLSASDLVVGDEPQLPYQRPPL